MQTTITILIKKAEQYVAAIFIFTIMTSLSLFDSVRADDTYDDADNSNSKHFTDTVTSGVYRVIRNHSSEISRFIGTRSGIEEELWVARISYMNDSH
jgi:hypothetical protein